MITYTELYKQAADNCGISIATSSQSLTYLQHNINLALRKFKNASRRYWTRKEVTTNLVSGQQYYTFPEDMVRITTAKATSGGLTLPITMIDSEELWNRINLIPSMTDGTAAGAVICALPTNAQSTNSFNVAGRADAITGKSLQSTNSTTQISITAYDNTYPGASGEILRISGFYEAA